MQEVDDGVAAQKERLPFGHRFELAGFNPVADSRLAAPENTGSFIHAIIEVLAETSCRKPPRHHFAPFLTSAQTSSARQTVVPAPSFIGLGKRPSLHPAHQVDFETGIGPFGAII